MEGRQRHCPHLGLKHTRAIRFSSPTPEHRCYIFGEPLPIHVDQATYCLGPRYPECPRFAGQEPPPAPRATGPRGAAAGTRALRSAGEPSGLARFWQQLGRRERVLYLALLGVLLLIVASYGIIVGMVLPARERAVPPTAWPTLPTVPAVPPTATPLATKTPMVSVTPTVLPTVAPSATPVRTVPTATPTATPQPPTPTPVAMVPTATPIPETMWSTLYFLGPQKKYFVPVHRLTSYTTGVARRAIELMIAGPRAGSNLLRSIPEGMGLVNIWRDGDTLYVDLDHRFEDLGAGEMEALAVVLAMTEFPGVAKAQFLVQGTPVGLPGSGNTEPVWRPRYVNFENPYNLAPEESVALTLYFATPDGQYLFPIVRRVPATVRTARTTVEEMIKGPSAAYQGVAISPLPSGTAIRDIYRDGSAIVMDLSSAFLEAANRDLAVRALVLAMVGLTPDSPQGIDSVRIFVEGRDLGEYWGPAYGGTLYEPIL
ncbi:MAG: GerMN domain-containing protein, partial [Chloroflexia bacterium]